MTLIFYKNRLNNLIVLFKPDMCILQFINNLYTKLTITFWLRSCFNFFEGYFFSLTVLNLIFNLNKFIYFKYNTQYRSFFIHQTKAYLLKSSLLLK